MKIIKSLLLSFLLGLLTVSLNSCKKKCKNNPPQARIINNGSTVASVQIKTSDGNTVNINNVAPGTSSDYASYAPGDIKFTITVNKSDYIQNVSVGSCYLYDIAIDNNNNITVIPIEKKYEK
jgi:hypothetical protein